MPNKEKREKKGRDFALCVKITEKVALNIASEASNVSNLSGQMLMNNAKIGSAKFNKIPQNSAKFRKIPQNSAKIHKIPQNSTKFTNPTWLEK